MTIQLNQINTTDFVKANPSPVSTICGILPKENSSLSLLNAEVLFEINARYFPINNRDFFGLRWKCKSNYTIFNPDETINITIGMPLGRGTSIYNYSLTIDNNPALIYNTISQGQVNPNISEIWSKYLDNIEDGRKFYIFNVTIPANDSVLINFSFDSKESSVKYMIENFGSCEIIYDVGTARVWNGNITEKVEFKVYGVLPDYCYYEEDCLISDLNQVKIPFIDKFLDKYGSKCYSWEWNNEIIEYNLVGIVYTSIPESKLVLVSFSFFGLVNVIAAMVIIISFKISNRKNK
ncbi:MAG: hypothetical protein ACFFBT_08690 [Promethearchaeota archaeon]